MKKNKTVSITKRGLSALAAGVMMLGMCSVIPKDIKNGILTPIVASAAYENTWVNTGNQRNDIVKVAETQIGYTETSTNMTKYTKWNGYLNPYTKDKYGNPVLLDGYDPSGYGYAWCQAFVSWCANQAGIPTSVIPKTAGTYTGSDFFKSQHIWRDPSYKPSRGDIIYFDWKNNGKIDHVGIVTGCDDNYVYTIEGNKNSYIENGIKKTSDGIVWNGSYSRTSNEIEGYGVPKYNENPIILTTPIVKTSKTSYIPGSNIEITWNKVDGATGYWIDIYKDGKGIISQNLGNVQSYPMNKAEKGFYEVYVSAFKDDGDWQSVCSERWCFDIRGLNATTIHTASKYYVPDGNIDLYWDIISGATGYWIDIWKDGKGYISENLGNVTSYTFKNAPSGYYEIYVSTYSDDGGWDSIISNRYEIYVREISSPTVSSDSKYYTPASNVTLNWDSIPDATGYWADLYLNGEHIFTQNIGMTTSYTIEEVELGIYEVFITAFNENGGWSASCGDAYSFYVKEPPSKPILNVDIAKDTAILSWKKCVDTDFYGIRIYNVDTNESVLYMEPYTNLEYVIEKLSKGNYYANIASVQKEGFYTFSEDVFFNITESKEIDIFKGDANCDEEINMADAVIIMQYLANPNKYGLNGTDNTHITEQGIKNADVNGNGVTNSDALEIQKFMLKLIDSFE